VTIAAAFAFLLGAALWAFTAVASRRIEKRYPALGRRLAVGGGEIHIVENAPAVPERGVALLIHGASGNAADMSVALGERLSARGFRVMSVDRPGHGWSSRIGGGDAASPGRQAELLRRAAERLGARDAVVVAHSLGCATALAMALDAPQFVRALVLLSPATHPWPGGVAWYYPAGAHPAIGPPLRRLIALPVGMALIRPGVRAVFAPNAVPDKFIETTRLPLVLRPLHFLANCQDTANLRAAVTALAPRYPAISAPTEIVTGDADGVVAPHIHAVGCERDIPGARLTCLPGVGHSPHHSAPGRVVEIIVEAERRARERETASASFGA
jgi:pimeloyl-ACP methyl ester carboxylesterase